MKLINPEGHKTILIQENEKQTIVLEDMSHDNRIFTLDVFLKGENAECIIEGRAQSTGKEKKKWTVRQIFENKNQKGRIHLRGIAEENGILEFDGAGVIDTQSQDSDIRVEEKILLFDNGIGKLLPVLTVKTNDVKSASHSASLSPISEDILLYFESRGYNKKDAQEIIKTGFLSE